MKTVYLLQYAGTMEWNNIGVFKSKKAAIEHLVQEFGYEPDENFKLEDDDYRIKPVDSYLKSEAPAV